MNWASQNDGGTRGTATHVKRGYSCPHEHVPVAMCVSLLGVYKVCTPSGFNQGSPAALGSAGSTDFRN